MRPVFQVERIKRLRYGNYKQSPSEGQVNSNLSFGKDYIFVLPNKRRK